VDIEAIATSMVAQAPLVAVATLLLYILLDRRFNALEKRVEAVEQHLGAVEGEVRGLRGEVRELSARVNNLETGVGALATRLDAVEKAVSSIAARLDVLEKDVATVKARLDAVEREVATIKTRLDAVEKNVADLANRLGRLESTLDLFLRSYHAYNHALLEVLAGRGVIQRTDVAVLRGYLRLAPGATSRYYTKEVEKRLREILDKEVLDWPEVIELERISHLIYKEWEATKRYDLLDYYVMLSIFISITKGHLLAEGKEPPDMAYAFTRPPPPDP